MKTRFTDAELEDIVALTGWNDATILSLYANFVADRGLLDEFTDWCRGYAEEELSEEERQEDEEAAWEEAGGPICPQCGVVYTGQWHQSHKMDCSIGRMTTSRLADLPEQLPEGDYRDRVQRYVDALDCLEDE